MAEDKGAAKTAGSAVEDAEFMSGPPEDHPNAGYNDPGATGPAPMPPVFADPDADAPAAYEPVPPSPEGASLNGKSYEKNSPEELQAEVDARELEVTGTGANGNVVKADLIKALEEDDAK